MTTALVTVELTSTTGIAKDSSFNSFAVATPTVITNSNVGELTIPIMAFYNDQFSGAGSSIAEYLASNRSRAAAGVKFRVYDIAGHLDGSPHGSPIATDTGTLRAAFAAAPLPSEMAVVMTTRAVGWQNQQVEAPDGSDDGVELDRPRQRYSGRVYLGPLDQRAVNTSGGIPRVEANFRAAIGAAAADLKAALTANGATWHVWSRTSAALRPVDDVQVDNAFDVQRRRGEGATVRETFAV